MGEQKLYKINVYDIMQFWVSCMNNTVKINEILLAGILLICGIELKLTSDGKKK